MSIVFYPKDIQQVADCLLAGEVVAIPTETVYGLAAIIDNQSAVEKIFELKNRPLNHPLIVHVADIETCLTYTENLPKYALKLAEKFWPGPLTLIGKKSKLIKNYITGDQSTVGIRIPNHSVTLDLLKRIRCGLAAPSANKFGKISPTQAQHVLSDFGNSVKVLDGGDCTIGLESTILDVSQDDYCVLLRPGMIPLNELEATIGRGKIISPFSDSRRVSGNLQYHYAPNKPSFLFNNQTELDRLFQLFNNSVYVLHINEVLKRKIGGYYQMPSTTIHYARELYQILREADQTGFGAIAIEFPRDPQEWEPIIDKLRKLTARSHELYKVEKIKNQSVKPTVPAP